MRSLRCACALLLLASPLVHADPLYVRAHELHTSAAAGVLTDAVVRIERGRIAAIGTAAEIAVPAGADVLDAAVVLPGLIDTRSTLGLSGMYNVPADQDMDETSAPATPELRALDAFNPHEKLLAFVASFGVTTVQAGPGDTNPIAGVAGVFKTVGGNVDAIALRPTSAMVFNLGEVPKDTYGAKQQMPNTRMAIAALIRSKLLAVDDYLLRREAKPDAARDLGLEALAAVRKRELQAVFVAHRADDIATALRIIDEFDLDGRIAYGTEGWRMTGALKAAGVPVLVGPTAARISSHQTMNAHLENAARLHAAGVPIAFGGGHEQYVPKARILLHELTLAVANGLPRDAAIRAATIDAATVLKVDGRVGSIEPGKDADLVLFDGDPFEYASHVTGVVIDGRVVSREVR